MEALLDCLRALGIDVKEHCPLAPHSSFRVGGEARAAVFPSSREALLQTLDAARQSAVRYAVFGNASNVVFSDEGFDGLVIFTGNCKRVICRERIIEADCGAMLSRVALTAREHALCGAEFMHGIPGTVGGAVFMNAGAYDGSIADVCVRSEYWDAECGEVGVMEHADHAFGTRTSVYAKNPSRYVILGATFSFTEGDPAQIRAKMEDFAARRRRTQPLEYPSAGSVFKRPVGHYAGKLIEDCGLKGTRIGGAEVSERHAGFIINRGGATAEDIRALTQLIRERVQAQTGVDLECEIRFIEA